MLIGSLSENHLISENAYEMTAVMKMESYSIINNIRTLFKNGENRVKYLLLLDGLNEVSRNQLVDTENNYIGTPSDLIVDEIQELLKYSNVSVVITSRTNETIGTLNNEFKRLYLTGVSEPVIEEYLSKHKIFFSAIKENKRLMEALKIPLFLKLYSQLYSISEISTPGEILYAFFSERSMQYSARSRITEITRDRRSSGNTHADSLADEKMQWFILDFLLPELGWYMEKNDLYTVDQATIKTVMDTVLKGTAETDICGKYGIAMFDDYHNGNDGSVNVKTYADQLLTLGSANRSYIQKIIDYCVYSLGILYVNNQNYGFIHQHIRDFFAALKNIVILKMALSINNISVDAGYNCLSQFNNEMIHSNVSIFIGEILAEYKDKSSRKYSMLENCIDLYRKKYDSSDNVKYGLYNLLKMIYEARKSLTSLNLSYLDLSNCHFNGINLANSILDHSIVGHDNLFPFGHTDSVVKAVFSNTGKYIYSASSDGTVKLWHASNLKYIKTVIKLENTIIKNITLSNSNNFLLVSTSKYSILYETQTYTKLYEYKEAFTGIFDENDNYLALAYYSQPIQLIDMNSFEVIQNLGYLFKGSLNGTRRRNIMLFSPDSNYIVFVNTEMNIEIWNIESLQLMGYYKMAESVTSIDFDSKGKRLGIGYYASEEKSFEIIEFRNILQNLKLNKDKNFKEHLSNVIHQKYSYSTMISFRPAPDILAVKFVSNDKYFLTANSDGHLQLYDLSNKNANFILQGYCSHDINYISEYKDFHKDYIVTGGGDGTIKIWNLKSLQCIGTIPNGSSGLITRAKFSPDGNYIIIAAKNLTIWDAKQGVFTNILEDKESTVTALAFSASSRFLAVGFGDGSLIIYEYKEGDFTFIFEKKVFNGTITNLQFEKNGNSVLISETTSVLKILNISSKEVTEIQCDAEIAWHSVFFPTDNSILYCDSQNIEMLPLDGQNYNTSKTVNYRQLKKLDRHMSVYAAQYIACSPDGKYIAFGWHGGQIEIRLSEDMNSSISVIYTGTYQVRGIVFSTDSKYMAVISSQNGIKIYETQNWNCIRSIHGNKNEEEQLLQSISDIYNNGHTGYVTCIDCCNDNQTFLSGSSDGTVKLWKPFSSKHQTAKAAKDCTQKNTFKKMVTTGFNLIGKKTLLEHILAKYNLDINRDYLDIYRCEYTLPYVYGLKLKNASIKNLHPSSKLSKSDYYLLRIYGADILEPDSLTTI